MVGRNGAEFISVCGNHKLEDHIEKTISPRFVSGRYRSIYLRKVWLMKRVLVNDVMSHDSAVVG